MLNQVLRNTGHVCGFPYENAYIVPQKPDERVFLFRVQVGSDESRLLGIAVDQSDLLVFPRLDVHPWGLLFGYFESVGWGLCCLGHSLSYPN